MFAEYDLYTSFVRSRRVLDIAGLTIVAGLVSIFVLMQSDVGPGWRSGAETALVVLLCFLFSLVIVTYSRFRRGLFVLREAQRARDEAASIEPMTGALHRAAFLAVLKQRLRESADMPVGYVQIDMDNLKAINDSYGHQVGDAALRHLVRMIQQELPSSVVGRLGGDEFALLLHNFGTKNDLVQASERLIATMSKPTEIGGVCLQVSATMGVVVAPDDSDFIESIMAYADLALYAGKHAGRNRAVAYEASMAAEEAYRRFIERELREALYLHQLHLLYQPIFEIASSEPVAYEALLRWHHPFRGVISPVSFIPIAERSGLIQMIGEWVLRQACRDHVRLGGKPVSINVSAAQLRSPNFTPRFLEILAEECAPASAIIVEVTETVEIRSSVIEHRNIAELCEAGIEIAIDDFGAGFTSLDYLKRFAFSAIKIDRSYISNIHENVIDRTLVCAIANIGRALNVRVVAEGVETEEQRLSVLAAGCTHVQGFLMGRPQSLATLFPPSPCADEPEVDRVEAPAFVAAA
ncbi:MAG: putative bifunctional diguanylate cyclase/phosphodiesterase [Rhabdaerophilum sp.]